MVIVIVSLTFKLLVGPSDKSLKWYLGRGSFDWWFRTSELPLFSSRYEIVFLLSEDSGICTCTDFRRRFMSLLGFQFRIFPPALALR